jgi:hypothetical protein
LIALANGIADPFDRRVVEAYWIGNEYLEHVEQGMFYESLGDRFKARMDARTFGWLTAKIGLGARPHHNFHVFDVYSRAGLMHDAHAAMALETMDSCRISWGRVRSVDGAELVVERPRLALVQGKLALAPPEPVRILRQIDGLGFAEAVVPGDVVSIHWSWACDVLTASALRRLRSATDQYLRLANETL